MLSNKCLQKKIKYNYSLSKSLNGHSPKCSQLEYGLIEDECLLISAYTGQASVWINEELKENGINNCLCKEEVKSYLNSGLNKMPSFKNKEVFHLSDTDDSLIKILSINVGEIVCFPTFFSCSKSKIGYNKKLLLQIRTSNISRAVDLDKFNPEEKEVLFNSGSCFKVISVNEKSVQLEEIEYDSFVGEVNTITTNEISKITTYR